MHLVVLSTYPPRRCGLATFTSDLRAALAVSAPHWRVEVCAVDRDGLRYGQEVVATLRQDDRGDYRRAAAVVAATRADLVLIQHEYGIFGGPDGSYLLEFTGELARLDVPYAATLHTVLSEPTTGQAGVTSGLCRAAVRVTGFTGAARMIATRAGWAEPDRFVVVPHGVPEVLSADAVATGRRAALVGSRLAAELAAAGDAPVLSTFGLLRPGKGLETAILAMPQIVASHPDARYLVAGATHPETVRRSGEAYRDRLVGLARGLRVAEHVRFIDAYLSEPELAALLQRTDVYLTPYKSAEQTCSGALTFALAAGCPVVSTAYRYARELAAGGDAAPWGVLVPFEDPGAFAEAVGALLADPQRLAAAGDAARAVGEQLRWPAVAARFANVLATVPGTRIRPPALAGHPRTP
jgi:glycosyltransferase involved in cell wall biosynthesis